MLLTDRFEYPDGLITNEYAYWAPNATGAVHSPIWDMTSGSLFCVSGKGWTGIPDDKPPGPKSTTGTNSAIFRLNTKRKDFEDVAVSFSVLNQGLVTTLKTPTKAWDGLHVWVRYQSEASLYYCSFNRRDNTVVIKKKVPGGPSNGGTYHELTKYVPYPVPYNVWQKVMVTAKTNADGSVTIALFGGADGLTPLIATNDNGEIGGAPIRGPGQVGIRGDNANLKFEDFLIDSFPPVVEPPPIPTSGSIEIPAGSTITVSWKKA